MKAYKISVEVDGRVLESTVKEGVLATIETGTHVDKVTKPEHRVALIVGILDSKPIVWTQIAKAVDGQFTITHEGWIKEGQHALASVTTDQKDSVASMESLAEAPAESTRSLEQSKFGVTACCTAYGRGCYVKCCGACCADPARCPGARCCP
jgi:hypothetical protein